MEDRWAGEGTSSGESLNGKMQISAKPGTGITERERKACLGFGFFGAVFLQLINCPNEGGALIRSRSESTLRRVGEEMKGRLTYKEW